MFAEALSRNDRGLTGDEIIESYRLPDGTYDLTGAPFSFSHYLGQNVAQAFEDYTTVGRVLEERKIRQAEEAAGEVDPIYDAFDPLAGVTPEQAGIRHRFAMDKGAWEKSEWFREGIKWVENMTPERARILAENYDIRRYREALNDSASNAYGLAKRGLGFGAMLIGGLADPINLFPFSGAMTSAKTAANTALAAGKNAILAGVAQGMKTGAVEGAVGGAVASAFTLPDLASKGEDVGFSDLLLTTAMGGILGSVFGAMGGGIAGYRGTRAAREVQAANDRFLASEAATQTESLRTTLARDIFDARLAANPDLDQAQLRSEAAVAAILFDRRAHSWASGEEGRAAQDYYATWLPAFRGAEDLETAIRNEWTAGRGIDNDFLSNFRPLEPEREQPPVVETPAAGKRRARRKQTSAPIETEVQPTNFRQNQGEAFQETARSGIQGREDSLATSAGSQPFRYEVRELDELVPSHDPLAQFQRRNDYPRDVQERPYHSDAGEQDKVRNNAANLDPRYLINDNPDAMTGPPIVTPGGIVLGGNSRTMSMQLASAKHAERFAAYKQALQDKAAQFGVDPAQIQGMRKPVLVRVVDGGKTTLDLANAARRYNEVTTQALQPEAEGVSKAKLVTPNTVAYLNTKLYSGQIKNCTF